MDINDFQAQQDAIKAQLAAQYGVPASLISLEAPTAGSLQVSATILTSSGDGSADTGLTAEALQQKIGAIDDTALSNALGVPVTSATPTTTTIIQQIQCPKGFWCTAGLVVDCDYGFYNPNVNANNQTACLKCPERSTTIGLASTRYDECVCETGYFDADESVGVACELCVSGTNCSAVGTTLAALPLRRGYYRRLQSTIDVRR